MSATWKSCWTALAVTITVAACDAPSTAPSGSEGPSLAISDAAHSNGRPHFFFLPPMVRAPIYTGAFDGTLEPVVEICALNGAACGATVATFTTTSGAGSETVRVSTADEHYIVNWHTDDFELDLQAAYRIRVLVEGVELGFADVDAVNSGNELRNVDTDEYIPLKDGRTLPIQFRIEEGAIFVVGPDGGAFSGAEGAAVLVVPAGALAETVGITADAIATFPADQGIIPGTVFDFRPDGTSFSTPATLTLAYDEANLPPGLPETSLTILTEESGEWREVAGSIVDPDANTLTAQIDGFSKKAVGGKIVRIEALPDFAALSVNETLQLTAVVLDAAGTEMARQVFWSSTNPAVASVGVFDGFVTAMSPGAVTIQASSGPFGGVGDRTEIRVTASVGMQDLTAMGAYTCGLMTTGAAYCWGLNSAGQLGDGTFMSRSQPVPVSGGIAFETLTAGYSHTCGLTSSGAAYCWGINDAGQLGDGTTTVRAHPVPVSGGLTFAMLDVGNNFTCGLTTTGAAYCWGQNVWGTLGDGTTTDRNQPVPVSGGLSFADLATGSSHACAVTAVGEAYCWGFNGQGQLGDGTTTHRNQPTTVSGGLSFVTLSAGDFHVCGLTTSAAAFCWGSNASNQLGDGTASRSSQPVAVSGGLTFAALTLGGGHSCGLTSTGAAYCWGSNDSGQLGDGTTTRRSGPVMVAGGLPFQDLDAAAAHTCALTTTSDAYCWGSNIVGQLGDGTTSDRLVPTPVLLP